MDLFRKLYFTLKSIANHPLNRQAKWAAVRNFCVAQVAVRLTPGDVSVPFPNNTRLLISPRMKGAAHFISPGLCEFDEMCFVTHFLRPDDVFVDVGANVGAYTVLASGVAGAKTLSFEPSPRTYEYLSANVRLNDLGSKVTPWNAAVGRNKGSLRLTEHLGTENYICPGSSSSDGVDVQVTTLDIAVGDSIPTLIKVDVEGFETEVFAGAQRLLQEPRLEAMVVERTGNASRYGYDEDALHKMIRDSHFIPCAYSAIERSLTRIGPEVLGNIVYVRDVNRTQQRVREALPFRFAGVSI